jgi:hypothetical protein
LKHLVQVSGSQQGPVHGGQYLYVVLGIEAEAGRYPFLHEPHDRVLDGFGFLHLDKIEVTQLLGRGQVRHPSLVDGVGRSDDLAFSGLPKDLRKPNHRHDTGRDQIGQHAAGADRGKLIHITDHDDARLGGDGT